MKRCPPRSQRRRDGGQQLLIGFVCGNVRVIRLDLLRAAEQKARATYDNILRVVRDIPEIADPIRFLRAREVVHFQRFGEGLRLVTDRLNSKNFYAFNPAFDAKSSC